MRLIDADELLTAFPVDDEPTVTKSCIRMTIQNMPTIEPKQGGLTDLYISDCGHIRRVGDNCHDMLTINKDGKLCYYNLQNGDGCRLGTVGEWYNFVPNVDDYGYNCDPRKDEPQTERQRLEGKRWTDALTIEEKKRLLEGFWIKDEPQTDYERGYQDGIRDEIDKHHVGR